MLYHSEKTGIAMGFDLVSLATILALIIVGIAVLTYFVPLNLWITAIFSGVREIGRAHV